MVTTDSSTENIQDNQTDQVVTNREDLENFSTLNINNNNQEIGVQQQQQQQQKNEKQLLLSLDLEYIPSDSSPKSIHSSNSSIVPQRFDNDQEKPHHLIFESKENNNEVKEIILQEKSIITTTNENIPEIQVQKPRRKKAHAHIELLNRDLSFSQTYEMTRTLITIGSDEKTCDIYVGAHGIEPQHCELFLNETNKRFYIKPLVSQKRFHTIRVNSIPLMDKSDCCVQIEDKDLISFCFRTIRIVSKIKPIDLPLLPFNNISNTSLNHSNSGLNIMNNNNNNKPKQLLMNLNTDADNKLISKINSKPPTSVRSPVRGAIKKSPIKSITKPIQVMKKNITPQKTLIKNRPPFERKRMKHIKENTPEVSEEESEKEDDKTRVDNRPKENITIINENPTTSMPKENQTPPQSDDESEKETNTKSMEPTTTTKASNQNDKDNHQVTIKTTTTTTKSTKKVLTPIKDIRKAMLSSDESDSGKNLVKELKNSSLYDHHLVPNGSTRTSKSVDHYSSSSVSKPKKVLSKPSTTAAAEGTTKKVLAKTNVKPQQTKTTTTTSKTKTTTILEETVRKLNRKQCEAIISEYKDKYERHIKHPPTLTDFQIKAIESLEVLRELKLSDDMDLTFYFEKVLDFTFDPSYVIEYHTHINNLSTIKKIETNIIMKKDYDTKALVSDFSQIIKNGYLWNDRVEQADVHKCVILLEEEYYKILYNVGLIDATLRNKKIEQIEKFKDTQIKELKKQKKFKGAQLPYVITPTPIDEFDQSLNVVDDDEYDENERDELEDEDEDEVEVEEDNDNADQEE